MTIEETANGAIPGTQEMPGDTTFADPATSAALPPTEQQLPESADLDERSTLEILELLNDQDARAASAVRAAIPQLAELVELGVTALTSGNRIHYVGAGTSGRLAVLDAAELIPTYSLEDGRVIAHIAGGAQAIERPVEHAEDQSDDGEFLVAQQMVPGDLLIGVSASGGTPYVVGALREAGRRGIAHALISCNPGASGAAFADVHVCLNTGPEVVTGSTRLKAGTAQKMALNSFSTSVMIRIGRTWSNLMVSVLATNEKLRRRTVRILQQATGLGRDEAVALLEHADGDLRVALTMALTGADPAPARAALSTSGWSVKQAVETLSHQP